MLGLNERAYSALATIDNALKMIFLTLLRDIGY